MVEPDQAVTLIGSLLPALIGGSVVVEFIFNLNGMGLLTLEAITQRDYNIVVGESLPEPVTVLGWGSGRLGGAQLVGPR